MSSAYSKSESHRNGRFTYCKHKNERPHILHAARKSSFGWSWRKVTWLRFLLKARPVSTSGSCSRLVTNQSLKTQLYVPNEIWSRKLRGGAMVVCFELTCDSSFAKKVDDVPYFCLNKFSSWIRTHTTL